MRPTAARSACLRLRECFSRSFHVMVCVDSVGSNPEKHCFRSLGDEGGCRPRCRRSVRLPTSPISFRELSSHLLESSPSTSFECSNLESRRLGPCFGTA